MIASVNPTTGQTIRTYQPFSNEEVETRLQQAEQAFPNWRQLSFLERGKILHRVAAKLRERQQEYARLMAEEMGKPVTQGRAEIEKCAWVCEYYADHAAKFLKPEFVDTEWTRSYVVFQPLGPILAVMPWNFPFWQVFRAAAPALMAGNPVLLKHASNVPGCALAIESLFREVEAPEGVFQTLLIEGQDLAPVIAHPTVRAVTLTGSTPAGQAVAAQAGQVLKKTVVELGGSDPYVVLEDADVDLAAETCVAARLINTGQSCIAAKRFIVVASIRKAFEERVVELMRAKKMGNPLYESTELGPLARQDLRDRLHDQVTRSLQAGARLLLGGTIPEGPGAFYPPTVLTDVKPGMAAFEEETFGPVAAIVEAQDEEEAIALANRSPFGLGAAVFTRDRERGERIARERLEAGLCFVNAFVQSDPRLPFGGIKQSGYGRELGVFGIREFVNIKTVCVA